MMSRILFLSCVSLVIFSSIQATEKIVWSGEVFSDGKPTMAIPLSHHKKYQIRAKGFVNLGKWIKNREPLANDACYEFSKSGSIEKLESLKNSSGISICKGNYNPDHTYYSEPFEPKENIIHFWVHDTDYTDNADAFQIQIVEVE